eukprot:6214224-Pleurochrysis_carterae.AAC.2
MPPEAIGHRLLWLFRTLQTIPSSHLHIYRGVCQGTCVLHQLRQGVHDRKISSPKLSNGSAEGTHGIHIYSGAACALLQEQRCTAVYGTRHSKCAWTTRS